MAIWRLIGESYVDVAFSGTRLVNGNLVEGLGEESSGSVNEPIVAATESDAAQAIGFDLYESIIAATESDAAQVVSFTSSVVEAITAATESDAAQGIGFNLNISITESTESDAAQAIGFDLYESITAAAESDTAQTLGYDTHLSIAPAFESDAAQTVSYTVGASAPIVAAYESDAAQQLSFVVNLPIVAATESDSAQALGYDLYESITAATESDAAQVLSFVLGDTEYGGIYNATKYFPSTQNDVVIELFDPVTGASIPLTDNSCVEIASTGMYVWDSTKLTTQPDGYQEYIYKMTDGATVQGGVINMFSAADSAMLLEIYKRFDLDDTDQNKYADDGSTIENNSFTLTKTDNGDGTFDIVKT